MGFTELDALGNTVDTGSFQFPLWDSRKKIYEDADEGISFNSLYGIQLRKLGVVL